MNPIPQRLLCPLIVGLTLLLPFLPVHAQPPQATDGNSSLNQAEDAPTRRVPDPSGQAAPDEFSHQPQSGNAGAASNPQAGSPAPRWDASKVAAGEVAFQDRCLTCHDGNRSLDKKKTYSGWRATVQRMAVKDGANIPDDTADCIATYLAAKDCPTGPPAAADAGVIDPMVDEDPLSIYGTLSPLWRGGNSNLQNPGFFPDVWVGAAWQSSSSPVSARVTACISCHNEPGLGSRIELVEAVVRVDLGKWLNRGAAPCERSLQAAVEAGRIVVPFGAFAKQSNPGVYRTVSKPLMFNMGQRVFDEDLGDPVLPMPYSDEGVNLSFSKGIGNDFVVNGDFYVVNGLQGGDDGIDFDMSRDYVDNNKSPAVGARGTIGNQQLTLGGSMMSGRFNDNTGSGPNGRGLDYWIYGADATYRYEDILRLQFEYAQRDTDRFVNLPNQLFSRDRVGGCYVEGELMVSRKYNLSLINRYDTQARHSLIPTGSMPTGSFDVARYTYGVNHVLPGGSLLMFNVEHWFLPKPLKDIDVLGIRWAATF